MARRKPRGINGIVKLTGGNPTAEFIPMVLPETKSEIERVICAAALKTMRANGWSAWPPDFEPRQLPENDFDFVFDVPGAPEYLDLAEVAPLEKVHGNYESLPATHTHGQAVDEVLRVVKRKSEHYGRSRRAKVHLLLYITDFRFFAGSTALALLKASLRREHYRFASIGYCALINPEAAYLHLLYPAPGGVQYFSPADEQRMRAQTVTNLDPRGWKRDPESGGFGPTHPE